MILDSGWLLEPPRMWHTRGVNTHGHRTNGEHNLNISTILNQNKNDWAVAAANFPTTEIPFFVLASDAKELRTTHRSWVATIFQRQIFEDRLLEHFQGPSQRFPDLQPTQFATETLRWTTWIPNFTYLRSWSRGRTNSVAILCFICNNNS